MTSITEIDAGFLPLTDSAILVAAREKGFAEEAGIALNLVRETSWANIRDRLAVEQFEIAHCLAPMPIASNLGLTPFATKLIAPMALGLGGNAVTVSNSLFEAMAVFGSVDPLDPMKTGTLLREVVKARRLNGLPLLQLGVVHPFSAHNFELRYWLAAVGIVPEQDVEITILPPALMSDAVAAGQIDGFCVGEPWNSVAVDSGVGKIVTVKSAIWASSPEKVLGMNALWAEQNEQVVENLIRSLYLAAVWCADNNNKEELAGFLSEAKYLDKPISVILPALNGTMLKNVGPIFEPHGQAATFPWQSHALWLYTQMVRWGQVPHSLINAEIARNAFRPDIYRKALGPLGAAVPSANSKVEGALKDKSAVGVSSQSLFLGPDGFFDGAIFDPDKIDAYVSSQSTA